MSETSEEAARPTGAAAQEAADGFVAETPFEDEEPGSYLRELHAAAAVLIWSAGNLALQCLLIALVATTGIPDDSSWFLLARLLWMLAPTSALVVLALALWHLGNDYSKSSPRRLGLAVLASILCLVIWIYAGWVHPDVPLFGARIAEAQTTTSRTLAG